MSESKNTWDRGVIRAKMLGAAQNKDKSRCELAESVVAMICCHGLSIRSVGREYGLNDGEVQDLLLEGMSAQTDKAVKTAYRAGRLSVMPPPKCGVVRMPLPIERRKVA